MTFVVYKPRGDKVEKVPVLSFSKSSIVLNNIAREKLNSQNVELAYDNESKTIRIKAVDDGGMQIKKTKIFGKGFFKHFNIQPRGKVPATYSDGALFADVSKILST